MEINTSQILKGTLEACILQLIKNQDMYGYLSFAFKIRKRRTSYKLSKRK